MIWIKIKFLVFSLYLINIQSCGIYSFTGASIPAGVTTFQVNFFENLAGNRPGSTVEAGLDNDFSFCMRIDSHSIVPVLDGDGFILL